MKGIVACSSLCAGVSGFYATQLCEWPIDVMLVQDTTSSMGGQIASLKADLALIIENIKTMFPYSRVGVADHRDKPWFPFGTDYDYCYKFIESGSLSHNPARTDEALATLGANGGGDLPEDHYQAAINTALDPRINWRPIVNSDDRLSKHIRENIANGLVYTVGVQDAADPPLTAGDEVAARVIIWLTDATPHYSPQANNLPMNEGTILDGDVNKACTTRDYMDPSAFKRIMKDELNFQLMSISTSNNEKVWQWINDDLLGQPASYRQIMGGGSALAESMMAALSAIGDICDDTTTTTPEATAEDDDYHTSNVETTTTAPATTANLPTSAPTSPATTTAAFTTDTPVTTRPVTTDAPAPDSTPSTEGNCDPECVEDPCCDNAAVVMKLKEQPKELDLKVVY